MTDAIVKYDVIVVGGGKAGKTLAMDLAKAGKHVAMIEQGMIGGTCINVACIPTKAMVASARVSHLSKSAKQYGISISSSEVDFQAVLQRKKNIVNGMRQANLSMFLASGMDFILGKAHFIAPKTLEVKLEESKDGKSTLQLTADKIFINTGALPFMPPIPGLQEVNPLTNEGIMELATLPSHLIIIGGGYIGLEFGQMFKRFGSEVTIVEVNNEFLPQEDRDIAEAVKQILQEEGVQLKLGYQINAAKKVNDKVVLEVAKDGKNEELTGSHILVSVGRIPNTKDLNLAATDVKTDARGFITVNEYLETNVPGIWAVGDVKGGPQFTHISLDDYRIVKANLTAGKNVRSIQDRMLPYTVFIDPELARIGWTEKVAREKGYELKIAKVAVADIPRAKTLGETKGVIKLVIDAKTDKILGAALLCPEGGEVLAAVEIAMRAGLTYQELKDGIYAHPTLSEGFNQLAIVS